MYSISLGAPKKDAKILKDYAGNPVPLDQVWTQKVLKVAFEEWTNSILNRVHTELKSEILRRGTKEIASLYFRRTDWVSKIIEGNDLMQGGTGRNITTPKIETYNFDAGKDKALGLEYLETLDLDAIGAELAIAQEVKEKLQKTIFLALESRALYGIDYGIKLMDGTTAPSATNKFLKIMDLPTGDTLDELVLFLYDLETKANQIVHTVTKHVQRINKSNVVIELNLDMATAIKHANTSNAAALQSIKGIAFDSIGDIVGLGGYKVFVDPAQAEGCLARVRWVNTLVAGVGYGVPYINTDPESNLQFIGGKFQTILGVIDMEFAYGYFTQSHWDSLTAINDPENAKYTPYYGNRNPQVEPFTGGTTSASKSSKDKTEKENINDLTNSSKTNLSPEEEKENLIKRINSGERNILIAMANKKNYLKEKNLKAFKEVPDEDLKQFLLEKIK